MFGRRRKTRVARQVGELLAEFDALGDEAFARAVSMLLTGPLARRHRGVFWGDRMLTLDKSAGFMSRPLFAAALKAVHGANVYDQYASAETIAWRLHTLVWAAERALQIPGDFVECGVFRGDMSWVVMETIDFDRVPRTFYLYDTFAGFSAAQSSPDDFPDSPNFFDRADQIYRDEQIYPSVVARFATRPNVRIIRGALPDAFAAAAPDRIAYLHLDLNSPAAETAVLERLFDRVSSAAAIVLDDYGWREFRRQKAAADAFFAGRGYEVLELPTGQGLVVKR